jgi:beta-glucanase (GH16 family)
MRIRRSLSALSGIILSLGLSLATRGAVATHTVGATTLGIEDASFTVNGRRTFLLGISYYGGLGAPEESLRRDLDDIQKYGFNWLRVWATWGLLDADISAVDAQGRAREPFLGRLRRLVAECDRRGLIVDVTLTRDAGGRLPDFSAHQQAVATLVETLKAHRNWYLDLANERDVRDGRYVSIAEIKAVREQVRRLDPPRLVTASFGGHDLSEEDARESLATAGLDFLCPHRPRHSESPGQTETRTRALLALMQNIGRVVPVHYQEPFRRGYTQWEPVAADFLADLRGAVAGGAAGWCFHNGTQRDAPDQEPRRSFDLRTRRLFDQLDAEELKFVAEAAQVARAAPGEQEEAGTKASNEWTRMGPLREAPKRLTDSLPLSHQSDVGVWVKYEPMSDEFEGGALDTDKWVRNMEWWKGRQPALFQAENVTVEDGQLLLTMRKEPVPEEFHQRGYHDYTSAAVHSRDRTCYGYFEVKARPMDSAGSSSFWFQQDATPGWATEIDVFEIGGKARGHENKYHMNLHVLRTPTERRHGSVGGDWEAPWRLADDFHVYGLEWDKEDIKYYVDGVLVRRVRNTHWHQPLYLIFDSETMPNWFGMPDDKDLPSTFHVEYVRAWKKPAKPAPVATGSRRSLPRDPDRDWLLVLEAPQ